MIKLGKTSEAEALISEGIEIATEDELNNYGYQLLFGGDTDEAIELFKLNIERNPKSWNAYDSLGEALMSAGHRERAIENYRKSVELNPANTNGKAILEQLEGER